ncbi:unnamed protein product [Larinioides sclopetarius]|uniref:Uncharacterized protein n=1 Tax=Larinioides sclopetarius TaxID=280406 RepID=A0AAV1Z795_9ARAC
MDVNMDWETGEFWCTLQPCVSRGRFLRVAIKIVIRLSFFVHTILLLCKRARLPVLSGSEEILTVDPSPTSGGLEDIVAFSNPAKTSFHCGSE